MTRHTAPADAAASQSTVETLPTWDLGDLYPSPDSPAVQADFAKAEQAARAFARRTRASSPRCRASVLAAAIAEYERIEEVLGRLASYAQLLFSGNSTNAEIGRFYQTVSERVTAISSHLLFFALELNRLDDALLDRKTRGTGAGQVGTLAARSACLPAAPACRRPGEAAAREGGDRAQRVEPAVR